MTNVYELNKSDELNNFNTTIEEDKEMRDIEIWEYNQIQMFEEK